MTWNIVSDSSCDMRAAQFSSGAAAFEVIPLCLRVGEKEYWDTEELNTQELLAAMATEKTASSTACPAPATFARAFEKADRSICFTISANLSGTYNAAVMGREMVLEEHPEKKICIIDSKSTAGAMILLIRKAKALIEADPDMDFEAFCDALRMYQASLRTVFTLENFDNLIKNGRMRPLVGTLLHSLGIHVIADATPQGTIHVSDKARGEVRTYKRMAQLMGESKDCTGAEVIISHCNNLEGAARLKQQILESLPVKSVELVPCRGLCSFYAMDKGLIVGF